MTHRVYNFTAGPCALPLEILKTAQAEFLDFHGCGMSIIEISHRSSIFEPVHEEALALAKEILQVPDEFQCLFLQGGGRQQFAMTAMNLMADGSEGAIINSGHWASGALEEGNRVGVMHEAWTGKAQGFTTLPSDDEIKLPKTARYLHVTANETIGGIEFHELPKVSVPLVVDNSSDYYTRSIPWERCDIVYGGAQKNLAPAGVTVVFVRKTLLVDHPNLPKIFCYKTQADKNSLYNTPPCFQIYMLNLMLKWIKGKGGLAYFSDFSQQKSDKLYAAIDASDFYHNAIDPKYRSRTNVIFRTPSEALDTEFWQAADKAGLRGLKGHRVVGGLRASLYNAMEMAGVDALIDFMNTFAKTHA